VILDIAIMIFSRILVVCFKFFPVSLSRALLLFTYVILSWIEKKWFLYYIQKDQNYLQTLRQIRNNLFCPYTVEKIYDLWINNPEHEALVGLKSE
jgi:hypothetical protein